MSMSTIHNILKDTINIKPNKPRGFSYQKSILEVSNFKLPDKIPSFVKSSKISDIFDNYKKIRVNFTKIVGEKSLKVIESTNSVEKLKNNALKLLKDIHDLGYIKDSLEKQFLFKLKDSAVNIKNISERLLSDFNQQNKTEMVEVINEALTTKKQKWIDNNEISRISKELTDLDRNEKLTVEKKNQRKEELVAELRRYINSNN